MNITLLDCKLPEKNTENIIAILRVNNMDAKVPDANKSYNCWGFVAFYFGWEDTAHWLSDRRMSEYLEANTQSICKEKVQAGDIAVFYRWDRLTHTALMMPDNSVVCHKPGMTDLCIDTLDAAAATYGKVTFVRPVAVGV